MLQIKWRSRRKHKEVGFNISVGLYIHISLFLLKWVRRSLGRVEGYEHFTIKRKRLLTLRYYIMTKMKNTHENSFVLSLPSYPIRCAFHPLRSRFRRMRRTTAAGWSSNPRVLAASNACYNTTPRRANIISEWLISAARDIKMASCCYVYITAACIIMTSATYSWTTTPVKLDDKNEVNKNAENSRKYSVWYVY